jgi:hypothetical protein
MLYRATELSRSHRTVVEKLLERPLEDHESVVIHAFDLSQFQETVNAVASQGLIFDKDLEAEVIARYGNEETD